MIQIGDTIVSLDIIEKHFACDVSRCKGACCIHGDSGAPLMEKEARRLEAELQRILPFLRPEGRETISKLGPHVVDADEEIVTPLVESRECAYVVFENGMARCGIEKAYLGGKTNFRKPVSCHLYPIRLKQYPDFIALNYDVWHICDPARERGMKEEVPLYRFVRTALERRFGRDWYRQLELTARNWNEKKKY